MSFEAGHLSRPVQLTAPLAREALALAGDASPHSPRQGEWVCSMTAALPAAELLVDAATGRRCDDAADRLLPGFERLAEAKAAAETGARTRFTDGLGHSRPHYHHLLLHVQVRAWQQAVGSAALPFAADALLPPPPAAGADAGLRLMAALSEGLLGKPPETVFAHVQAVLDDQTDTSAALQPRTVHDALDHWTYHELVALHALDQLARFWPQAGWTERLQAAALFHQAHTQPDYTTYQPWALAAFFGVPETDLFAEQQLHDTQTHLSLAGRPGALLPAVLLAQACLLLHEASVPHRPIEPMA